MRKKTKKILRLVPKKWYNPIRDIWLPWDGKSLRMHDANHVFCCDDPLSISVELWFDEMGIHIKGDAICKQEPILIERILRLEIMRYDEKNNVVFFPVLMKKKGLNLKCKDCYDLCNLPKLEQECEEEFMTLVFKFGFEEYQRKSLKRLFR